MGEAIKLVEKLIILCYIIFAGGFMKKIIIGSRVSFLDDDEMELMYIDYPTDECIWFFNSSDEIAVGEEDEIYYFLDYLMNQHYTFDEGLLRNQKNDNELIWYSDCYYDLNNKWSINNVSYLTIIKDNNSFKLKCTKPLYDTVKRVKETHCICFSPMGNGRYAKNMETGMTLQDDFVMNIYRQLLNKDKIKVLK